ncbi:MAG: SHOCT domain-containing protein [Deinococcota bacterium]
MTDHVSVDYTVNDATIFGPWVTLLLIVVTVALVAISMRGLVATGDDSMGVATQPSPPKNTSALEDAEARFAKGEISREEFDEIRKNA